MGISEVVIKRQGNLAMLTYNRSNRSSSMLMYSPFVVTFHPQERLQIPEGHPGTVHDDTMICKTFWPLVVSYHKTRNCSLKVKVSS